MPSKSTTYEMIRLLSGAEKRYVMERLRSKEKELFEFLTAQKSFDSEKIRAHFPDFDPKAFASLKQRLLDRIARLLSQKAALRSPEAALRKELDIAKGLLAKGFATLAISKCKKTIPEALRLDQILLGNEFLQVMHCALDSSPHEDNTVFPSKQWLIWTTEINARIYQEAQARTLLQKAQAIKHLPPSIRATESAALLNTMAKIESPPFSKAYLLLLLAQVKCSIFLRNFEKTREYIALANTAIKELPPLQYDSEIQVVLSSIYIAESGIHVLDENYAKAKEVIEAYRVERQTLGLSESITLREQSLWIDIKQAMHFNDTPTLNQLAPRVDALIKQDKVTRRWSAKIGLDLSVYLFWCKSNLRQALPWLERIQKTALEGFIVHYWAMAFLLEQLIYLELQDWDNLFAATRRAQYHLKKYPDKTLLEMRLGKILHRIAKAGILDEESVKDIQREFESKDSDPYFSIKMMLFDLAEWGQSLSSALK